MKYAILVFSFLAFTSKSDQKSKQTNVSIPILKKQSQQIDSLRKRLDRVVVDSFSLQYNFDKSFKTDLYDLKYLGYLKTNLKEPYFILSGRTCDSCDENISIYVWSPSSGNLEAIQNKHQYTYPGKEFHFLNGKLLFESKMYFGLNNQM